MSFLRFLKVDLERYKKKRWKGSLQEKLGRNFEVIVLQMPNPTNAQYDEWKILFRKAARLLENKVVLVGHSLGGVFLAKYLSENKFPKKIIASILIAAPYDEENAEESLTDFVISHSLEKFKKQSGKIFLYYSEDDPVVSSLDLKKYQRALPDAVVRLFKKKGHFNQPEFPELIQEIKRLYCKRKI